jgi:conjugative transfer pilus assembly protein TraH
VTSDPQIDPQSAYVSQIDLHAVPLPVAPPAEGQATTSCLPRLRLPPLTALARAVQALAMVALLHLALLPILEAPARASVEGAMDSYFDEMGVAANVTGPTAYQGQSAGYYSLGNVWTRFPQKTTNIANLRLPSARGGCGGIDVFGGSFSFINGAEIVALMKAIANNAIGFAFQLAIDSLAPEVGKVMEAMRQASQLMNQFNINSCETAQGIVGGLWPRSDAADKSICQAVGNSTGVFSDWAASRHGCGTQGQRTSTINSVAGNPDWDDVNSGVARNYTWHILKNSPFFKNSSGVLDRELAQYVMTLIGTIIYVPPTDTDAGGFNPIPGDTSSALVTALLDGTASGAPVQIWQCDAAEPDDACLAPTLTNLNVSDAAALRPRVAAILDEIVTAVRDDTPISADAKALLQVASLPLYKILTVQAAYSRGLSNDDRATLSEIAALDLLFAILDQVLNDVGKTRGRFIAADENRILQWQNQFGDARRALLDRQQNTQVRISAIMQIIQQTTFIESVLQSGMSPSMTASMDWSRAINGRSLN